MQATTTQESQIKELIDAIHEKKLEELKELIKNNKLLVNIKLTDYGETALHIAAGRDYHQAVEELLAAGADINLEDTAGETPLLIAATRGYTNIVETLLAVASAKAALEEPAQPHGEAIATFVNRKDSYGNTPLYNAAGSNRIKIVELLIKAGADINLAENFGETSLHFAAANGHAEVVKQLIAANANVNKANPNGITPLYNAAANGHAEVVKELIAANANVNKASYNDTTPLHIATANSRTEVVKQLIKAQANVNAKNKDGETPLSKSLWQYCADITKDLLLAGANPTERKNNFETSNFIQALKTINIESLLPTELSNIEQSGCYALAKLAQLESKNEEEKTTFDQEKKDLFMKILSFDDQIKFEFLKSPELLEIIKSPTIESHMKIKILTSVGNEVSRLKLSESLSNDIKEILAKNTTQATTAEAPRSSPSSPRQAQKATMPLL